MVNTGCVGAIRLKRFIKTANKHLSENTNLSSRERQLMSLFLAIKEIESHNQWMPARAVLMKAINECIYNDLNLVVPSNYFDDLTVFDWQ